MTPPLHDRLRCLRCGAAMEPIATAYGYRAPCFRCDVRWTWIRGEAHWVEEAR